MVVYGPEWDNELVANVMRCIALLYKENYEFLSAHGRSMTNTVSNLQEMIQGIY